MLIGEYTSKIGEKKRVAIPKKIREELGNNLILTRGYEDCLILVNKDLLGNIAKDVINGTFIDKSIRETSRFLIGSAFEIEVDGQGRVVIPSSLFEHAKLGNEVVFVGLFNWVEVWDIKKWKEKLDFINQNSQSIADELKNSLTNK